MPSLDRNPAIDTAGLAGRFITFEGGDGVGKSTQVARLRRRLSSRGIAVVITREPGGTERAERIREILLRGHARRHGTLAEAALFAAARLDHVDVLIRPALLRGETVICDRFIDSSRVYQGAVGSFPPRHLSRLEEAAIGELVPHLTLVLDLPTPAAEARVAARRAMAKERVDRFEAEGAGYHEAVKAAFRHAARSEPGRCVLIDASGGTDEVESRVWGAVRRALGAKPPHG